MIASILLIINLGRSIYDVSQREQVVHDARQQLAQTKQENDKLKKELEYVQSPGFIEQQARERLNLARPDETVVILPDITPPPEEVPEPEKEIWQQWLEVFRLI